VTVVMDVGLPRPKTAVLDDPITGTTVLVANCVLLILALLAVILALTGIVGK